MKIIKELLFVDFFKMAVQTKGYPTSCHPDAERSETEGSMYFPCTGTINTRNPAPQAAAAILRRRSSCSALLSAPIVKASRTPSDNAYFRASS